MSTLYQVGSSPPRPDGLDKVSGRARYTADLRWPDMLHGATLRSPHPHARIERLGWRGSEPPGVRSTASLTTWYEEQKTAQSHFFASACQCRS